MTREEFTGEFDKLASWFSLRNAGNKVAEYYAKLQEFDAEIFGRVAANIRAARSDGKFPSIWELVDACDQLTPKAQEQIAKQPCGWCDGYGWVHIDGLAYRGRCQHSKGLSSKILLAPASYRSPGATPMNDDEIIRRISFDPMKFLRGFLKTGPLMKRSNPEFYQRVRHILFEIVGPERAKAAVDAVTRSEAEYQKIREVKHAGN